MVTFNNVFILKKLREKIDFDKLVIWFRRVSDCNFNFMFKFDI